MAAAIEKRSIEFSVPRKFKPLLRPARFKGAHGGRGSAKSHFFAERMVKAAILRPGFRGVCVREIQRTLATSSKLLIEDKIRKYQLEKYFRILDDKIKTPGNGMIIFNGMQNHTVDSIKSLEGFHVGWVEEAQTLSQRSLDYLTPTFRNNSELWFSWNRRYRTDPVDQFMTGPDPHPRSITVEVHPYDNPFLPAELAEEMEWMRRRNPAKYAHIYGGGYIELDDAQVFKNWTVEEFEAPKRTVFYLGADWGYSVDPTVLIRCFIDHANRKLYIDQEAYQVGCEIDFVPFLFGGTDNADLQAKNPAAYKKLQELGRRYPGIPGSEKWAITGDSARPETISYLKKHGFPRLETSIKGANSVEEGIEFLQTWDIVVHPRCVHTIDELTFYSFKRDKYTDQVVPILEDKKNHVIDALRYAVERLRRKKKRAGTF